jgi:hypothetical protein
MQIPRRRQQRQPDLLVRDGDSRAGLLATGRAVGGGDRTVLLFSRACASVDLAARELRCFWWLVLLVALAIWLIWGIGRKSKL